MTTTTPAPQRGRILRIALVALACFIIGIGAGLALSTRVENRHRAEWEPIQADIRTFIRETPGFKESASLLDPLLEQALTEGERTTATPPRTERHKRAALAATIFVFIDKVYETDDDAARGVAEQLAKRVGFNPYFNGPAEPAATRPTTTP